MAADSLIYSLIQALHNLGAALALGAPVFWLALAPPAERVRPILGLLAAVWALQGITGAGFGAASWLLYGRLPELHPIAVGALALKVFCMLGGLALSILLLARRGRPPARGAWFGLAAFAAITLSAAAVLRWNS